MQHPSARLVALRSLVFQLSAQRSGSPHDFDESVKSLFLNRMISAIRFLGKG